MTATVRSSHLFASDLPTASEIQEDASGTLWLRRRLTGHWQRDPRAKEAFQREIEANSRIPLGSPSLVPLRSAGDAPELWLSREYFPCGPLSHRIRAQDWPSGPELLTLINGILWALHELEKLGLVHGDPGPWNVMLTAEGTVKLADLCSARARFAESSPPGTPGAAPRHDGGIFLTWLAPVVSQCDQRDPLVREITEALAGGESDQMKMLRLRRLAEARAGAAAPIARPATVPTPPAPLQPVAVDLVVGPARDRRSAYLASKLLAGGTKRSVAAVFARLRRGTETIESAMPGPAVALLDELAALKIPVRVLRRGRSARTP